MKKIRCAVIGVGYLGRFHAQKYQNINHAQLVAVCDQHLDRAQAVGKELQVDAYTHYEDLWGKVDAVSIAATTCSHYTIAEACLKQGIHVLLEKPMTETVQQAQTLIQLAKQNAVLLQIGHLERFNPAILHLHQQITKPLWIHTQRLGPFIQRTSDVNVIFDLMIHDLDLVLSFLQSPVVSISAQGQSLVSSQIDLATAQVQFKNGCIASFQASRVHAEALRKTEIIQDDSILLINYQNKTLQRWDRAKQDVIELTSTLQQADPLQDQITSFLEAILHQTPPSVPAEAGLQALILAQAITDKIQQGSKEPCISH